MIRIGRPSLLRRWLSHKQPAAYAWSTGGEREGGNERERERQDGGGVEREGSGVGGGGGGDLRAIGSSPVT